MKQFLLYLFGVVVLFSGQVYGEEEKWKELRDGILSMLDTEAT